ncbi:MAG: glycosyltransferase [Desulfobulbaceae bacterium]|nr:glycosyltransferase [Desulfobulbaceae bacterium]
MKISVVISTRNRSKQLASCISSFSHITFANPFELVIVDNGSTDNTSQLLHELKNKSTFPIKIVYEPIPGLGRARNAGWRAASGQIIAFTDDDCYPDKDWLTAILQCYQESTISFLGGKILLYDQADWPITIQLHDQPEKFHSRSIMRTGMIQGANFSFPRKVLESIDGFDPMLGAGTPFGCEDVDILARLTAQGLHGAYDPRPIIYHHHGRKLNSDILKLLKGYEYARGAYYTKCLLNPPIRKQYAINWLQEIRHQDIELSLREIIGGLHYLIHRWTKSP